MQLSINIDQSIRDHVNNLLNNKPKTMTEKDKKDWIFIGKIKEELDKPNSKFFGYWWVTDPSTGEQSIITITEIIQLLRQKKSLKVFYSDLNKLLSRGDGSGPARVKDGSFGEGKFDLFVGAERIIKLIKFLLED